MAFICVLDDRNGWGDIGTSEHKIFTSTVIGYDDEMEHVYHLYVSFDRQNTGYWELSFYIIEYDANDEVEYTYFHSNETRSFLDKEARRLVVGNVLGMIRKILDHSKFETCIFYSIDTDMPAKGLLKYTYICAIFISFGYDMEYAITRDGQHIWKFLMRPL